MDTSIDQAAQTSLTILNSDLLCESLSFLNNLEILNLYRTPLGKYNNFNTAVCIEMIKRIDIPFEYKARLYLSILNNNELITQFITTQTIIDLTNTYVPTIAFLIKEHKENNVTLIRQYLYNIIHPSLRLPLLLIYKKLNSEYKIDLLSENLNLEYQTFIDMHNIFGNILENSYTAIFFSDKQNKISFLKKTNYSIKNFLTDRISNTHIKIEQFNLRYAIRKLSIIKDKKIIRLQQTLLNQIFKECNKFNIITDINIELQPILHMAINSNYHSQKLVDFLFKYIKNTTCADEVALFKILIDKHLKNTSTKKYISSAITNYAAMLLAYIENEIIHYDHQEISNINALIDITNTIRAHNNDDSSIEDDQTIHNDDVDVSDIEEDDVDTDADIDDNNIENNLWQHEITNNEIFMLRNISYELEIIRDKLQLSQIVKIIKIITSATVYPTDPIQKHYKFIKKLIIYRDILINNTSIIINTYKNTTIPANLSNLGEMYKVSYDHTILNLIMAYLAMLNFYQEKEHDMVKKIFHTKVLDNVILSILQNNELLNNEINDLTHQILGIIVNTQFISADNVQTILSLLQALLNTHTQIEVPSALNLLYKLSENYWLKLAADAQELLVTHIVNSTQALSTDWLTLLLEIKTYNNKFYTQATPLNNENEFILQPFRHNHLNTANQVKHCLRIS